VPRLVPRRVSDGAGVVGDPPSPVDLPTGCRFHPRCPLAQEPLCSAEDPLLMAGPDRPSHLAACHFAWTATPPRHTPEILEEAT
jgi:oligopeptide/dipeptide ABC transporter ATP-binding protein